MSSHRDHILAQLTIRIKRLDGTVLGTGFLYYSKELIDSIYVLTAAHCLYADGDEFTLPIEKIALDFFNLGTGVYETLHHTIRYEFVSPHIDRDVAILVLNKSEVETITGSVAPIPALRVRPADTSFIIKGFPRATLGQELASIQPSWIQEMLPEKKFQLQLNEDYLDWQMDGFSGSGVIASRNEELYLYGIFTRFREEGKGKVIYCQYIETFNTLLEQNYFPPIPFSFAGAHGLNLDFFNKHILTAIENLGPRFNKEINLKTPIVFRFNELAKDTVFRKNFVGCFDHWLLSKQAGYNGRSKHALLTEIEDEYQLLQDQITEWVKTVDFSPETFLDPECLINAVKKQSERTYQFMYSMYERQAEQMKIDGEKRKEIGYREPYELEIQRLRHLLRNDKQFLNDMDTLHISLTNHPYLFIKGEAGCGKSHLLGDMAKERTEKGLPTLLFLGQLFKSSQDTWTNILSQLKLSCSRDELLETLNTIGQQKGSRVLLLFDALNEGAGKEIWPNELAGLLQVLRSYTFIGAAFTVRSTYWNQIVPEQIRQRKDITIVSHEGFRGNEYEALHLFCEHYKLTQPSFPILTPEFTNPLFLTLICQGVKASGKNTFPQGFQGIASLFNFYVKAVDNKLTAKREEYVLKPGLVAQSIREVSKACFEQDGNRLLVLEQAIALFEKLFPKHPSLLHDLIQEGVFIQNSYKQYGEDKESEVIYFAYERFSDFLIAESLLSSYTTTDAVKKAFLRTSTLGKLLDKTYWKNTGLIEAFSVLLPEKYALEITEVYDWVYRSRDPFVKLQLGDKLNLHLMDSLKWRPPETINAGKLQKIFRLKSFQMDQNDFWYRLTELAAIPQHPFNSDYLHKLLKPFSMPERDGFWQNYLASYHGKNEYDEALPISRLIEWAWLPGISAQADPGTVRLVAQALSWILASTHRILRDQATKALVNLLEEHPKTLVEILNAFNGADDPYIQERLYAVAYGCTLRTSKDASVQLIAQFTYDTIFKDGSPPVHVLLRDYARNIVEYALYKQLHLQVDETKIRPPYNSPLPLPFPTVEGIAKYKKDRKDPDYEKNNMNMSDRIHFSVMDWDFGKYTVESVTRTFAPVSFTLRSECKAFYQGLNQEQKELIKLFKVASSYLFKSHHEKEELKKRMGEDAFDNFEVLHQEAIQTAETQLNKLLSPEQLAFFSTKGKTYLHEVERSKTWYNNELDKTPILCWVVERAYQLGYDAALHGSYDASINHVYSRSDRKKERIGKKYQWIALHQITAIIGDHYMVKNEYSEGNKTDYFKGPWQMYLRDIDPAFTSRSREKEDEEELEDELGIITPPLLWWQGPSYQHWNQPDNTWVLNKNDLPNPKYILTKTDESKEEWLYLNLNIGWNEPKPIGQDRYDARRKMIRYSIHSYLVKAKDKKTILKKFQNKDLWNRGLGGSSGASRIINREKYWAPAYHELHGRKEDSITEGKYKMILTTTGAVGEMDRDQSGAHFNYDMPCQTLFDGMGLQYASRDGDFKDKHGNLVVTHINPNGLLIRKKELIEYLRANGMDILWLIIGDKMISGWDPGMHTGQFRHISGVYHLEGTNPDGSIDLFTDSESD